MVWKFNSIEDIKSSLYSLYWMESQIWSLGSKTLWTYGSQKHSFKISVSKIWLGFQNLASLCLFFAVQAFFLFFQASSRTCNRNEQKAKTIFHKNKRNSKEQTDVIHHILYSPFCLLGSIDHFHNVSISNLPNK